MTLVRRLGLAFAAMALSMGLAGQAKAGHTATLAELLNGAELTLGDKVFSNFTYAVQGGLGGTLPANSDVQVTLSSVGMDYTITFTATQGSWNAPTNLSNIGGFMSYQVDVTDPTVALINGASIAGTSSVSGTGVVSLTENLYDIGDTIGVDSPFTGVAYVNSTMGEVEGSTNVSPSRAGLLVQTVFAISAGVGGSASLTEFSQTFNQTSIVPEPSSIALVGLGAALVGGDAVRRRRKA
jgi:hypothetical protein